MKISYLILLSALCGSLQLQAQQATKQTQQVSKKDSVSLNRELTLEKEYNPSIRDAAKINQLPEIKEPEAPKTQVDFANYTTPFEVKPQLSLLKASPYFTDLNYSKKRGYLSAGVSTFVDIDGDLGYQILNSDKDQLSLFGTHRSSNGNVTYLQDNEKQKMKINDNMIGLDYMHNFGKVRFNADFGYTYSAFNYYGWTAPDSGSASIPRNLVFDKGLNQVNNAFDVNAGISSNEENELNYLLKLGYTSFQQKYANYGSSDGPKENRFSAYWDAHKNFNSTMSIGFGGYFKNYSQSTAINSSSRDYSYKYNNALLNPYLIMEGDRWDARLGVNVNLIFGDVNFNTHFAPDLRFNYRPTEKLLFYLIAEGGVKDNGNYAMFGENRYVSPDHRVLDSKTSLDGTVGVKASPTSNLWFELFAGYKITDDEHFFTSYYPVWLWLEGDYVGGNIIYPMYMDAKIFKLGGSLKYDYQKTFDIGLKATYYNWKVPSSYLSMNGISIPLEAWNKPSFESDLTLGYQISNLPLKLDLVYHLEAGRKALGAREIVEMKNINDLRVKGTYTINETFSIFGQVNNLLFQKYDLWYGYPAQNFSFMGGLNIRF